MRTAGSYFRVLILLCTTLWFGAATLFASRALTGFFETAFLVFFGFGIGVAWCGATLAWLGVFRSLRRAALWLAVPVAPFIALLGFETRWPMIVRMRASEPELRSLAERSAGPPVDWGYEKGPGAVGYFDVKTVHRRGPILLFETDFDWLNMGGVAYVPDSAMSNEVEPPLYLHHLYGPWYSFVLLD